VSGRRLHGRRALITGAGGGIGGAIADAYAREGAVLDLRSVFLCSRGVLPAMLDRGWGRIISVASQLGIKGAPAMAHYAAAKAGVPLRRFGLPEEVAPTAVLLAAEPDSNLYAGQVLGPNSGDVMP
jgi:3-oxoacyl-[acyl-carrier protein] reductase